MLSTGLNESYKKISATALECTDACSVVLVCWAFLFTTNVPTKCVMYDEYDGPFQTRSDKILASGGDVCTKLCNFECTICIIIFYLKSKHKKSKYKTNNKESN